MQYNTHISAANLIENRFVFALDEHQYSMTLVIKCVLVFLPYNVRQDMHII